MSAIEAFFKANKRVLLCGAPEGVDALILAQLVTHEKSGWLHICRDDQRLAQMSEALAFFAPDLEQVLFPAWDCLPYDRVSPMADIVSKRMAALARLAELEKKSEQTFVVLTTVSAMFQRLPPKSLLASEHFSAKPGAKLNLDKLTAFLSRHGFNRVSTVMEPGDFALRGGLVDLYPAGFESPVRLDLFGDILEKIRTFDPLSQRTTGELKILELSAAHEAALNDQTISRFRSGYRDAFGVAGSDDPLYESVSSGRRYQGMEHWLPLFFEKLDSLFDYTGSYTISTDHQMMEAAAHRLEMVHDHYNARVVALKDAKAHEIPYKALPPQALYLSLEEFEERINRRRYAGFSPFVEPATSQWEVIDVGGRKGRSFAPERANPKEDLFQAVKTFIEDRIAKGKRVMIAAYSVGARERLVALLKDHELKQVQAVATFAEASALPPKQVPVVVVGLEYGFDHPNLVAISEQDILGDRLVRPRRKTRRAENFLAEVSALNPGDFVVHFNHGIGRYDGLKTLEVAGAPHDCLQITYADNDRLYVPVENLEVLSRYGSEGSDINLDKLGGVGWQNRRAKLRERLRDMADALLKTAAERELRRAERLSPPAGVYEEFCAKFPYEETEDQIRAIDDTLADMVSGKPMDRLICGDVGFGKTEVALRAAFSAALAGKQVAVLAPTTLLVRQHFHTFSRRFQGLPLRIGQLSRLVPPKDAKLTKEAVKDGTMDIVVGTHALLSKEMSFKHMGLIIVDEEQHFGVAAKERLKQIKADVHVLTLTATPIPRTLQMALTGVKELSLISTPPVDRLAVRTFVMPQDPVSIREALMREHHRGGQSFYVCPRIQDLEDLTKELKELVPELKVAVAHGRMPPTELENVMGAFYERQYDILLATNIVESGLDIPTVNTLIIHRADMFGLAQLYQLRGRVGRAKLRGYAYLTTPPSKLLATTAEKRLHIMQTLDSLGAGFTVASHDMDLRGAGNLLGDEQSGHVKEVGIELYQQMLEEAVAAAREAKAAGHGSVPTIEEPWSPVISLGISVMIPENYIPDLNTRMALYRRLAGLEASGDIEAFAAEMIDRFGPLPESVDHLLKIVEIKQYCRLAGVEKLDAGQRGGTVTFRNNKFANPYGLVQFIAAQGPSAKLRPDHKMVQIRDWEDGEFRLKGCLDLVKKLAKIAADVPVTEAPGVWKKAKA